MQRTVIISTPIGYVAGFNSQHQCVSVAATRETARQFTEASAAKFMARYADAGYGLCTETAVIVPAFDVE